MATNRLNLDFSLSTTEERKNFIDNYIQRPEFTLKPPTNDELEMMGNYILWGKDKDGLSSTQRKEIQIETRNKTWTKDNVDSLEGLMENPAFNEGSVIAPTLAVPKIPKQNFSRSEALRNAPEYERKQLTELFKRIDTTELLCNFYEFAKGKRKEPPRDELLERFSALEVDELKAKGESLTQYHYLKLRHLLVELRREQYTIKDSYTYTIHKRPSTTQRIDIAVTPGTFDTEISVFPMGIYSQEKTSLLVFKPLEELIPKNYTEEQLNLISKYYWRKQNETRKDKNYFDFTDIESVYNLILQYNDLAASADAENVENNIYQLLKTLDYYIIQTELTDVQKDILDMKIKRFKNQTIASTVNQKYGKTYTANYISTIFRQKIIKEINDTAAYHSLILSNLFFAEEFKTCTTCGRTYLRDARNFVRRSRTKDGFANRCKSCDKIERQKKKGGN